MSDVIVSVWREIVVTLEPIIGTLGMAALYKRTLDVNLPAFPWLEETAREVQAVVDLPALKAVLTTRTDVDAADCGRALVKTFKETLATLLGRPLTEQLLRSIPTTAAINPVRSVATS